MRTGSYSVEETWSKYIFHIKLHDGSTIDLEGRNYQELLAKTQKLIGSNRSGRPLGTKNFSGRQFNEKDIKRLFGRIDLAVSGAAIAGHVQTLQEIAQEMVNKVAANHSSVKGDFNSYTGRLQGSYVASVISNRKIVARLYPMSSVKYSRIKTGPKGGKYAVLSDRQHEPAAFIYYNKKRGIRYKNKKYLTKDGNVVRYLKSWEKDSGYIDKTIKRGMSSALIGDHTNDARIRSSIVLENTAPYADAVQRAHYRVLQNASARSIEGKYATRQKQLIRVATKRLLEQAGFKIK